MTQYLEILGTMVGLLYLYFEYRASIYLWATSIVMPLIYTYIYYSAGFYADMSINIYYLGASVYGLILWMRKTESDDGKKRSIPISRTPRRYIASMLAVWVVLFGMIAAVLINFTDSTVPFGDSFTTSLSIIALWMLSRKYAEQWLVWLVVDVVCAGLYLHKGLYFTAGLYSLYCVIAVFGYLRWLKLMVQ